MTSSCRSGSVRRLWRGGAFILLLALIAGLAAFAAPAAKAGSDGTIGGLVLWTNPASLGHPKLLNNIDVYAFKASEVWARGLPQPGPNWNNPDWSMRDLTLVWPDDGSVAVPEPVTPTTLTGNPYQPQRTDILGHYSFGIAPGDYYLWFQDARPNQSWLGQWAGGMRVKDVPEDGWWEDYLAELGTLEPWMIQWLAGMGQPDLNLCTPYSPWNSQYDPADVYANGVVTVTPNIITEKYFEFLTPASHIRGTVTDEGRTGMADRRTGLADIGVYLYPVNTAADDPAALGAWVQDIEAGGLVTPATYTNARGEFDIAEITPTTSEARFLATGAGPDHYYVYFSDSGLFPNKVYAPEWWDDKAPWDIAASPTPITIDWCLWYGSDVDLTGDDREDAAPASSADPAERRRHRIELALAGSIEGTVYSWMRQPLEGIHVHAYPAWTELFASPVHMILGSDVTDWDGTYDIRGLAPSHSDPFSDYLIKFHDPLDMYQTEWWSEKPFATEEAVSGDPTTRVLVANGITALEGGKVYGNVDATLNLIPRVFGFSPYWAVTNNPDPQRPLTVVTIDGRGLNMLNTLPGWALPSGNTPSVYLLKDNGLLEDSLAYALNTSVSTDGATLTAEFDLVEQPVPAGMYEMWVVGWDQFDQLTLVWAGWFQLINVTTPTPPPVDPYTPPAPTPSAPPTTLPVVNPPVVEPVVPVAGAITTKAPSSAIVKKGKVATLNYQVDEAVLGGAADVTIQIKKSGKVVKTFKIAKAPMNSPQTKKFTCNLAKGKYVFYVSAAVGAASSNIASNTLTVK